MKHFFVQRIQPLFRPLTLITVSLIVALFCIFSGVKSYAQLDVVPGEGVIAKQSESNYQIGPQDVLQISVWKDEILSREVVVRPDGYVSFPLIGEVLAEDRPVDDVAEEMDERLTKFVSDPRITVAVSEVNSFKIYVIGKVNKPGEFKLGQYTDVMQALSLAGGLTPFAREGSIKILRRIHGSQTTFPFDYGDVLKGENLGHNIVLKRGDIVMVP